MASLLLAAGTPGMRYSLPNSRIMIHQPSGGAQVENAISSIMNFYILMGILFKGTSYWYTNSGWRNFKIEETNKQSVCTAHWCCTRQDWKEYGARLFYESKWSSRFWYHR